MTMIVKLYFYCRRRHPDWTPAQCWAKSCQVVNSVDMVLGL